MVQMKRYPGVTRPKGRKHCQISFFVNGRRFRETVNTDDPKAAYEQLCKRVAEASEGTYEQDIKKIKVEELTADVLTNYTAKGNRSYATAKYQLAHIDEFFGYRFYVHVTAKEVEKYITFRRARGASDGSIRNELVLFRRAIILGVRNGKVKKRLYFDMPPKSEPRKGFFELPEFESICRHLPDYVIPMARFAYVTGWRLREVMWLTWGQVNFKTEEVFLYPEQTKNKKGRVFPFTASLRALLLERQAERYLHCPYVFHHNGHQIKDFRAAWNTARKLAGLAHRIFHDLRRTAVRNLVRAGVPVKVAMEMCGHETMSVAFRYNIVSPDDMRDAVKKLDAAEEPTANRHQNEQK